VSQTPVGELLRDTELKSRMHWWWSGSRVDRCREGRDSIREAKESSENWTNNRVGFVVGGFEEVVGLQERISRRKMDAVRSGDA